MSSGFAVAPSAILTASAGFTDIHNWAQNIRDGLIGSCDTYGGMAGDDDAGSVFAPLYDKAADAVVNGFSRVVAQLGRTANGLFGTAQTYVSADADIASRFGKGYSLPSQGEECEEDSKIVTLPSARGYASWPVSHIIARFWPQGNPAKLQQAAGDWRRAASLIADVAAYGQDETIKVTAACQSSAIDAFEANWARTQQTITGIADAATQISSACSVYAAAITKLRAHLEHLAEIAGGVAIGAGVLTFFTLGASDVAGGIGEGAIIAEAGAAAAAMTSELTASADVAVLAEAAETVDQAAAALTPIDTAARVFGGTASAELSSYTTPARVPGVGPIPPEPGSPFRNLSPAKQAEFRQWMARMQAAGRTQPLAVPPPGASPNYAAWNAYQRRIAGNTEYKLYTTVPNENGTGQESMVADGVRSQDGAAVEAKYINNPQSCQSPYTIGNVNNRPDFLYQNVTGKQEWEMVRYESAIKDPRNDVNHIEIDTNDPTAAAYFDTVRRIYQVPGQTRVVP